MCSYYHYYHYYFHYDILLGAEVQLEQLDAAATPLVQPGPIQVYLHH